MRPRTDLEIDIVGTQEHADLMNAKLLEDVKITHTRPFLNKAERDELQHYYGDWASNHLMALMNFDNEGNFLPDAYAAPKDMLRLLYPIEEIMSYERQGTLIIDREQYTPALRNLSYYIYIVDEELYNEYFDKQRFLIDRNQKVMMYNLHQNDGIRVFKNYFELAKYLRKQRLVTFILGPRAMFYMRFYLYQIHEHVVDNDYAYGRKVDNGIARTVIDHIRESLAFQIEQRLTYNAEVKDDDYTLVRVLASKYNMKLPDIKNYKNKTEIVRYSKLRFGNGLPLTVKKNKLQYYAEKYGIQPYHSCTSCGNYLIFFVWDKRRIDFAIPIDEINSNDLCSVKWDNHFDLAIRYNPEQQELWDICQSLKHKLAIQFRDMNLL